jgi:hypothetical protein
LHDQLHGWASTANALANVLVPPDALLLAADHFADEKPHSNAYENTDTCANQISNEITDT